MAMSRMSAADAFGGASRIGLDSLHPERDEMYVPAALGSPDGRAGRSPPFAVADAAAGAPWAAPARAAFLSRGSADAGAAALPTAWTAPGVPYAAGDAEPDDVFHLEMDGRAERLAQAYRVVSALDGAPHSVAGSAPAMQSFAPQQAAPHYMSSQQLLQHDYFYSQQQQQQQQQQAYFYQQQQQLALALHGYDGAHAYGAGMPPAQYAGTPPSISPSALSAAGAMSSPPPPPPSPLSASAGAAARGAPGEPVVAAASAADGAGAATVGEHPSRALLLRNLDPFAPLDGVRATLESFGEVRQYYLDSIQRGILMVLFYDVRHAVAAYSQLHGAVLGRARLEVHYAIPRVAADAPPLAADAGASAAPNLNHGTLVIFNLDPSIGTDELYRIFNAYGEVKEIRETPNKKHHKFVEFFDTRHAERAMLALNKTELKGKRIKIEPSRPGGVRRNQVVPVSSDDAPASPSYYGSGGSASGLPPGPATAVAAGAGSFSPTRGSASYGGQSPSPIGTPPRRSGAFSLGSSSSAAAVAAAAAQPMAFAGLRVPGHGSASYDSAAGSALADPFSSMSLRTESGGQLSNGSGVALPLNNDSSGSLTSLASEPHAPPAMSPFSSSLAGVGALGALAFSSSAPPSQSQQIFCNTLSPSLPFPALYELQANSGGSGSNGNGSSNGGGAWAAGGAAEAHAQARALSRSDPLATMSASGGGGAWGRHRSASIELDEASGGAASSSPPPVASLQAGGSAAQQQQQQQQQQQPQAQFNIDLERIRRGDDARTTVMVRNIPNKYTQRLLLQVIDEQLQGQYDFFYLPIDFKNKCNVGYAFINMRTPDLVAQLCDAFQGRRWKHFNSEKVCDLKFARIQGKQKLISHFQNSSLLSEDKKCRPILFRSSGPYAGEPEPFPVFSRRPGRDQRDDRRR